MLIASLMFNVRPDKRGEFVGAAEDFLKRLRTWQGCLGCRLVSDCENENVFVMMSEWDSGPFLDHYLASPEFQIIEGTRILLRDGPSLSVDEVLSRRREPRPKRPRSAVGTMLARPPRAAVTVAVGGSSYWYADGAYYTRVVSGGSIAYQVVAPPAGIIIPRLPGGCKSVRVGNVVYSQCGPTYYQRVGTGYRVVVL